MEPRPEEFLRSLLEQNYVILEQYSKELEKSSVAEKRVEEILVQVNCMAVNSMKWLHDLISRNSDPVQSESLESSVNYLQYAISKANSDSTNQHKALKQVLYFSKMALLSFWSWWQLILVDLII